MVDTQIVPRIHAKAVAIQQVKMWLPKAFIDRANCGISEVNQRTQEPDDSTNGIKCLQNFRREWDEKGGCWANRPLHNWASHGYDSLETLVRGLNAYTSDHAVESVERTAKKKSSWRGRMRQMRRTGQAA